MSTTTDRGGGEGLVPAFSLSASTAAAAISAARTAARDLGVRVCIAVSDHGGHLVSFERMGGAPILSIQLAQDKAYSVCAFQGLPTDEWWPMLKDEGAVLHGIVKTDRLVVFGGGAPVRTSAGDLVGAVGVSGGSAEQDAAIARAGAADLFA
jgi:glc operon protein GlcG